MSGVTTLRAAIEATNVAVNQARPRVVINTPKPSPKPAPKPKTKPTPKPADSARKPIIPLSPESKAAVDAVTSFYPPAAIAAKLLTGGSDAVSEWKKYAGSTLAELSGKSDKDIDETKYAEMVSQYVILRAALAKMGYALPETTIQPALDKKKGFPVWGYALIGLAVLGGVVFGVVTLGGVE